MRNLIIGVFAAALVLAGVACTSEEQQPAVTASPTVATAPPSTATLEPTPTAQTVASPEPTLTPTPTPTAQAVTSPAASLQDLARNAKLQQTAYEKYVRGVTPSLANQIILDSGSIPVARVWQVDFPEGARYFVQVNLAGFNMAAFIAMASSPNLFLVPVPDSDIWVFLSGDLSLAVYSSSRTIPESLAFRFNGVRSDFQSIRDTWINLTSAPTGVGRFNSDGTWNWADHINAIEAESR